MKLNSPGRKCYAKEQTDEGVRQWLIVAALVASLVVIFIGVRLIIR